MAGLSDWFSIQLASSADGLAWAAAQVPVERQQIAPPGALGEWSVARHIFHMFHYELTIALPGMRQWLGEPLYPVDEDAEEMVWNGSIQRIEDTLPRFRAIREQQIALLPGFAEADWQISKDSIWGQATLLWVMTKTYQHTAEHINNVLRIALFWEIAAQRA